MPPRCPLQDSAAGRVPPWAGWEAPPACSPGCPSCPCVGSEGGPLPCSAAALLGRSSGSVSPGLSCGLPGPEAGSAMGASLLHWAWAQSLESGASPPRGDVPVVSCFLPPEHSNVLPVLQCHSPGRTSPPPDDGHHRPEGSRCQLVIARSRPAQTPNQEACPPPFPRAPDPLQRTLSVRVGSRSALAQPTPLL